LSSTATNKQPLLVDRPLSDHVRVTTQIAGSGTIGSAYDLNVQGGQVPAILVDMDATLSSDNNNGGIVDSITITRDTFYREPDYVVNTTTSGTTISLTSGQLVYIEDTGVLGTAAESGVGYYTYTGTAQVAVNTSIIYSGLATGNTSGFSYQPLNSVTLPAVTFVFYQTRNTTNPIPASGDYDILFKKTLGVDVEQVDCSDVMPQISVPAVSAGNTTGLGETAPLRNKGIYLERGDRLYVGVFPAGSFSSGIAGGAHVTAQGGYY